MIVALIYYHNHCKMIDNDSLQDLEFQKESLKKTANEKAILNAGYFMMFISELKESQDMFDNCSDSNPNTVIAKGWLEFYYASESSFKNSLTIFTNLLKENSNITKTIDAFFGKAKSSEVQKKFSVTLDSLNEILVTFPKFIPALAEKAKVLMMIGDWEQSIETCNKISIIDKNELNSMKIVLFNCLARDGNIENFCKSFSEFLSTIEQIEPKNSDLMLEVSKLFSRVSGANPSIIKMTIGLLQKCRKINPLDVDFAIEMGYQLIMLKDYTQAFGLFQEAASLDDSRTEPLVGMIRCRIKQGMIDDAEKQIEFINEIHPTGERSPEIAFLEGILNAKKTFNLPAKEALEMRVQNSIKFIDEALKLHIQLTKSLLPGFEFYIRLDPYFLLCLAEEYLQFVSFDNILENSESSGSFIVKGNKLLETITKQIPGMLPAHLLLAKGKLAVGDTLAALKSVNKVVEMNPQNEEAYIVHAIISIKSGNPGVGQTVLSQAIANNFQIRENPLFLLFKGQLEYEARDYNAALQTLELAYDLPGIRDKSTKKNKKIDDTQKENNMILPFGEKERCKIFVYLAKTLVALKRINEAKGVITRAISEFTGTEQEVNVLIANSEIAIQTGDIKKALSILKAVTPESPYFVESRKIMADVYLNHLIDRRHYAKCYKDLIDFNPSFDNYKLLGDALMRIQEPEDAIMAYTEANKINNKDENIIRDMGKALVSTHNYGKASEYYENALKQNPNRIDLKLDLGNLYILINNFKRASELLNFENFADDYQAPNIDTMKRNVQGFLSIYKLNLKRQGVNDLKPNDVAKKGLERAIQAQLELIERCKIEGGFVDKEKTYLAELYQELSKYNSIYEKDDNSALNNLDKANKASPENTKVLCLMAEIFLKIGDKNSCETRALQALKINPSDNQASYILSEILLQNDESSKALSQFQKILEEHPDNYSILAKLIEFFKKTGKLEEAKSYLDKSQTRAANNNDPGLCYCRGIYQKYSRNPQEALKEFNKAKRSSTFKEESISHMIDILLNPEQELYFSNSDDESCLKSIDTDSIKTAESLLKELQIRGNSPRVQVLESYIIMFSKKNGAETAIIKLSELLRNKSDYVPGILALSVAKFLNKKQTEAKNHLKMLAKRNYTSEYADDIEKAWLLYADSFIAVIDLLIIISLLFI